MSANVYKTSQLAVLFNRRWSREIKKKNMLKFESKIILSYRKYFCDVEAQTGHPKRNKAGIGECEVVLVEILSSAIHGRLAN